MLEFVLEFSTYFFIFSFLGWTMEVAYAAYKHSKFVNRGFLNSPFCPIYGFAIACINILIKALPQNDIFVVVVTFLLPSALELITGFLMHKLFNFKWWDYSNEKFNLGGYVCLKFSIIWGFLAVFLVKIIFPLTDKLIKILPLVPSLIVLGILALVLIIDCFCTVANIIGINKKLSSIDRTSKGLSKGSDKIGAVIYKAVSKMNILQKRIINAFPNMKTKKYKSFEEFKKYYKEKKAKKENSKKK